VLCEAPALFLYNVRMSLRLKCLLECWSGYKKHTRAWRRGSRSRSLYPSRQDAPDEGSISPGSEAFGNGAVRFDGVFFPHGYHRKHAIEFMVKQIRVQERSDGEKEVAGPHAHDDDHDDHDGRGRA